MELAKLTINTETGGSLNFTPEQAKELLKVLLEIFPPKEDRDDFFKKMEEMFDKKQPYRPLYPDYYPWYRRPYWDNSPWVTWCVSDDKTNDYSVTYDTTRWESGDAVSP